MKLTLNMHLDKSNRLMKSPTRQLDSSERSFRISKLHTGYVAKVAIDGSSFNFSKYGLMFLVKL